MSNLRQGSRVTPERGDRFTGQHRGGESGSRPSLVKADGSRVSVKSMCGSLRCTCGCSCRKTRHPQGGGSTHRCELEVRRTALKPPHNILNSKRGAFLRAPHAAVSTAAEPRRPKDVGTRRPPPPHTHTRSHSTIIKGLMTGNKAIGFLKMETSSELIQFF